MSDINIKKSRVVFVEDKNEANGHIIIGDKTYYFKIVLED